MDFAGQNMEQLELSVLLVGWKMVDTLEKFDHFLKQSIYDQLYNQSLHS
jgi:hypothetical protein